MSSTAIAAAVAAGGTGSGISPHCMLFPDPTYDNLYHLPGCDQHKSLTFDFHFSSSDGFDRCVCTCMCVRLCMCVYVCGMYVCLYVRLCLF